MKKGEFLTFRFIFPVQELIFVHTDTGSWIIQLNCETENKDNNIIQHFYPVYLQPLYIYTIMFLHTNIIEVFKSWASYIFDCCDLKRYLIKLQSYVLTGEY